MPNYIPISSTSLAGKRWLRFTNVIHAAADAVAPLVFKELPKAMLVFPIAFSFHSDQYIPVAMQGLVPDQNFFINKQGKWIGDYVPAHYRSYPFSLVQSLDDKLVLCIDEDSGLISDTEGELFFDDTGQPSQSIKDILEFLTQIARNRQQTRKLCALLHQYQIIEPWPLTITTSVGNKMIDGLHRIREVALNECEPDVLHQLQSSGALALAYCQLLSMQHLDKLTQLADLRARQNQQTIVPDLEQLFGEKQADMFKF